MTSLRTWIKRAILAVFLLMPSVPGHAEPMFKAQRGLNMDIWVTWPDEQAWSEETLLPFPEWRRTVDAERLAEIRAAGFDFLRVPIDPSPFLSPSTQHLRERLIDEVVASARAVNSAGLKAIVDLHLFPAGANRSIGMQHVAADPALFERYLGLVRDVASALSREDPELVALELMNEPVIDCEDGAARRWPDMLVRLFAAARASATRTTLVLSGACWGGAETLAALDPGEVPDTNIIWSFHSYAPFLLTHQGAGWAGDFIRHVSGLPYPLDAVSRQDLEQRLDRVRETIRRDAPWSRRSGLLSYLDELVGEIDTRDKLAAVIGKPFEIVADWADRNGIARSSILLGEFGMIRQEYGKSDIVRPEWRAAYYSDVLRLAEQNGFSWAMWGYGGAFGIVESFDGRRAEPDVLDAVRSLSD